MYKNFEIIERFIRDIYGCSFLGTPLNGRLTQISELAIAHKTIRKIIDEQRPPFSTEFIENVFPILEVAVQWDELRKVKQITDDFLRKCRERMGPPSGIFRGTIFEIDMVTRCLLSNWKVDFPEDYTKKGKQVDLVVEKPYGERVAVECKSMRGTEAIDPLKVNENIQEKCSKFHPEHLELLGIDLKKKVVVLDLTRGKYETPQILKNLNEIEVCNYLDGIVLTWREDFVDNENHSLQIKYKALGSIPDKYFSTTWAAEFHKGPVFFLRKYVEPEPAHGEWGPEETHEA